MWFSYFAFFGHQNALSFDFHPVLFLSPILLEIFDEFLFKKDFLKIKVLLLTIFSLFLREGISIVIFWVLI